MADDISKKITIEVEAQTEKLQQNIAGLNQIITQLQANQQKLIATGNENTAAFEKTAAAIDKYQKQLSAAGNQLKTFTSDLSSTNSSLQKSQSSIDALAKANDKLSKSISGGASKLTALDQNTKALTSTTQSHQAKAQQSKTALDAHNKSLADGAKQAKQLKKGIGDVNTGLKNQQAHAETSKTAVDAHKITVKQITTELSKLKGTSDTFGPSLSAAAEGFNFLKTGLSITQTGFKGIGTAIKETGFGWLLQILEAVVDYFAHTTEGIRILQGIFSAVGIVVNKVTGFIDSFKKTIIDALTHPVESIKALGKMIMDNIVNRFKAFSVILDGIIHLDFKKMANGAMQAITGVTDATDKIGAAFTKVKDGIAEVTGQMAQGFEDGYNKAGQKVEEHEKKVKESTYRQIGYYDDLSESAKKAYAEQNKVSQERETIPQATSSDGPDAGESKSLTDQKIDTKQLANNTLTNEKAIVEIKKSALQQVEDYAKKSAGKIATDALNTVNNSIKQQSAAKIAALEKDKAQELSNKNLTAAQKQAIEAKYKKQEAAVKLKAFKDEQKASIAQALINGATAITKAEAQAGELSPLVIPGIIAQTAIQVATISKQKPPAYAKGGYFRSDGKGALLSGYSRADDTNAYLRSGEAVVVSEAMRDPWARNLVSAINVAFGGRDFSVPNLTRGYAVGGIFTDGGNANRYYNQPVNDQKNLANTVAYQMVNNFPPVYVDVKDINNQQNILAQTINRVNL
ncbi:MAG: hypothetical protein ACXVJN_15995 [Mucilaginibacter sp.]